jgi:FKBP-type peptidyl-prolyl cis-trans isomerase FkpA
MTITALLCLWLPAASFAADTAPAAAPKPAAEAKSEAKPAAKKESKKDAKPAGSGALKTDEQKMLYSLGYFLGNKATPLSITPAESKWVEMGVHDGIVGNKPAVDIETFGPKVNEFANERTKKAREAAAAESGARAKARKEEEKPFVAKAAAEKGAQKTASGLVYIELKAGTGKQPTADDVVKVNYEGKLTDGKVFDSSYQRKEPIEFPLKGVIPCWTEGVQKMKVGGKARLVCPSDIAYGDEGRPPVIPSGATLDFTVELLDIVKK